MPSSFSACRTTPLAATTSPTRLFVVPRTNRTPSVSVASSPRARVPPAARAPAANGRGGPTDAGRSVAERRLPTSSAADDDQDAVDRLRRLGEHMARDERRATASGETNAGSRGTSARPPGRARSRARRDERLQFAQRCRREPQPLPHSERVPLRAAILGGVGSRASAPRPGASPERRSRARASAGGSSRSGRGGSLSPRARRRRAAPAARARSTASRTRGRGRSSGRPGRAASAGRRLAGTVQAEEARHRSRVECKREPVHGGQAPVALRRDSATATAIVRPYPGGSGFDLQDAQLGGQS